MWAMTCTVGCIEIQTERKKEQSLELGMKGKFQVDVDGRLLNFVTITILLYWFS